MDAADLPTELVALPRQPDGVPFPTDRWPTGTAPPQLAGLLDHAFDGDGPLATTHAVAVVHGGRLVAERYDGHLEHFDRPPEAVTAATGLRSWSMAKSMLHAVVGILVGEGRLDVGAPAAVPEWVGDERQGITLDHLLTMRDGLDFVEDYVDDRVSDTIAMLFGAGEPDMAAFAANRGVVAPPDVRFNYSSGTTNIVSRIVAGLVGPGPAYERFLRDRLFGPLGMATAVPTPDAAGTWVASSYVTATAQDFARFGLLYLRDGWWDGRRLLPAGWVDHGRRPRSRDDDGDLYGALWWVVGDRHGTFWASGYEGQSISVCPALDLVVVRLGKTPVERREALRKWKAEVTEAFAGARAEPS